MRARTYLSSFKMTWPQNRKATTVSAWQPRNGSQEVLEQAKGRRAGAGGSPFKTKRVCEKASFCVCEKRVLCVCALCGKLRSHNLTEASELNDGAEVLSVFFTPRCMGSRAILIIVLRTGRAFETHFQTSACSHFRVLLLLFYLCTNHESMSRRDEL